MQPIIRRTITITITETWTITWEDGRETVWTETHEVAAPAVSEPGKPMPPLTDDQKINRKIDEGALALDPADPTVDDE